MNSTAPWLTDVFVSHSGRRGAADPKVIPAPGGHRDEVDRAYDIAPFPDAATIWNHRPIFHGHAVPADVWSGTVGAVVGG